MAKSSAMAVRHLSPPESSVRLWSFFPGGCALIYLSASSVEQIRKYGLEVLIDSREILKELLLHLGNKIAYDLLKISLCLIDIVALARDKLKLLGYFLVFIDRIEVYGAKSLDLALKAVYKLNGLIDISRGSVRILNIIISNLVILPESVLGDVDVVNVLLITRDDTALLLTQTGQDIVKLCTLLEESLELGINLFLLGCELLNLLGHDTKSLLLLFLNGLLALDTLDNGSENRSIFLTAAVRILEVLLPGIQLFLNVRSEIEDTVTLGKYPLGISLTFTYLLAELIDLLVKLLSLAVIGINAVMIIRDLILKFLDYLCIFRDIVLKS